MKIAVLFPQDIPVASWNMGRGLAATLRRMGHSVTPLDFPTAPEAHPSMIEFQKKEKPKIEWFKSLDLIITSGPEHIGPWMEVVYGKYDWKHLDVPKAAWFHESLDREDYPPDVFGKVDWIADYWFFPAIQDQDRYSQEIFAGERAYWLPYGIDENIFRPAMKSSTEEFEGLLGHAMFESKVFDIAFLGLLYPKRQSFMKALARHQMPPVRIGQVNISDLHGFQAEESAKRYAANIRQIKVFFNMPAMSRCLVTKVYEVLACGTFLMTPMLSGDGGASKNMAHFEPDVHLHYYRASNLAYVAQKMREFSSDEGSLLREKIAKAGCDEVHRKHTLTHRLTELMDRCKVSTLVS